MDESMEYVFPMLSDPALARIAVDLKQMQRAAIRIHATLADEALLPVGSSKLGGSPDLPLHIDWPTKRLRVPPPSEGFRRAYPDMPSLPADGTIALPFIAQFNCGELAAYDLDNRLPSSGMLYFFYNTLAYYSDAGGSNGIVHDHGSGYTYDVYDFGTPANWHVMYYDGDLSRLSRTSLPATIPEEARYQACSLTFATEWTLPSVETCFIGDKRTPGTLTLTEEEWEVYADLRYELRANRCIHQLLGHSDDNQPCAMELGYRKVRSTLFPELAPTPQTYAGICHELEDAQLLLQVDEQDNGMRFGRDGRLYFFIRDAELRACDFSKVWVMEQ